MALPRSPFAARRGMPVLAAALALAAAATWGPPPAQAQVPPDTTVARLPAITVTAPRSRIRSADASARVTVLDAQAGAAAGLHSVAALLDAQAGAFVRRYGTAGLASISLRGAGASQTLVLLDGHRIADPQLGQLDLSLLPTVLLAGVEVLHGAGSALYGSDALGGVINLRALRPRSGPLVRLMGTYGAFGERQTGLVLGGRKGRASALVAAEYFTAAGDFPYLNAALFPPREVRRQEADARRRSFYATLGYQAGRHALTASAWHLSAERGLPGPGTAVPRGERQWDTHLRVWAADHVSLRHGTLRLSGLFQDGTLRYVNPFLRLDQSGSTRVGTLEAEMTRRLGTEGRVAGGVTGTLGRARHPSLRDGVREHHLGVFTHLLLPYGRLHAQPALRLDAYRATAAPARAALSPRLGLNGQPFRRVPLSLKASAGRAFRTPTFNDRFWQPGGNPDLHPERGWTLDGGAVLHLRHHLEAEVTYFVHRVRDQIVWQPVGSYWTPANVSRVTTRGVEASARTRQRIGRQGYLTTYAFYTFTDARDRSNAADRSYDQPLRYVPRHQFKSTVEAAWRMLRLDAAARYTGRRYVTTDGTQALDPYWVMEGGLSLQGDVAHTRLTFSGRVENLLGAAYEGIKGYPMPLRAFRLTLLMELGTHDNP